MITKPAFSKTIYAALFATAMLFGSSATFAQVKIGTNPTSINAANNLEVEASTTGRKTSIDKTTGKVTIADGSQGVDRVLTSDANGLATWQKVATSNVAAFPKAKIEGASTADFVSGVLQDVAFSSSTYSTGGAVKVGNGIQVPTTGYYLFHSQIGLTNSVACTGTSTASSAVVLLVNGAFTSTAADDKLTARYEDNFVLPLTSLIYLNANDIVTVKAFTNSFNPQAGCTTKVTTGQMVLTYQP